MGYDYMSGRIALATIKEKFWNAEDEIQLKYNEAKDNLRQANRKALAREESRAIEESGGGKW